MPMILIMALMTLSAAPAFGGQVLYVDGVATPGGTGNSWEDACRVLQDAIASARAPSSDVTEIRVAAGIYRPDDGETVLRLNRDESFELLHGVALRGGYAGVRSEGDPNERDALHYTTILSGDLSGNDDASAESHEDNSYHVVTAHGGADGRHSAILDGFVITGGYANSHSLQGAIGAGAWITSSRSAIVNCRFLENDAFAYGAGMAVEDSNLEVTGCLFTKNASAAYGGAMSIDRSAGRITSCTFDSNHAASYGGAITGYDASPKVSNCVFLGNSAAEGGAAYFTATCTAAISNSTFHQNQAEVGGAMMNAGDGVHVDNCVMWGNTDAGHEAVPVQIAGGGVVNFSIVEGGWEGLGGAGILDTNPRFVDAPGNLELMPGSPGIDAGDNRAVPSYVATDHAGNPRFRDDVGTPDTGERGDFAGTAAIVDIGAFEFQGVTLYPCLPDLDASGDVGFDDYLRILSRFGQHCIDCREDLDGDFLVGFEDLLVVLSEWGPCE